MAAEEFTAEELAAAVQLLRSRRSATARARPPVQDEGTVFIRGEGGAVFEMTPAKMSPDFKRRLLLGYLRQVNPDGSPLQASAAAIEAAPASVPGKEPVARPAKSAPKRDWVLYAVTTLGLDPERAEVMTRQELIDLPPDHALYPAPTPGAEQAPAPGGGLPDTDAPKSEWIDYVVKSGRISREDAEAYTKDDLIDMVG